MPLSSACRPWVAAGLTAALLGAAAARAASAEEVVLDTTGEGAVYELRVPDAWSGDLVVYAHGIVDPAAPIAPPAAQDGFAAIREALLARGYAVASTSYSENGYAVKDGAQRVHQLSGLFTAHFGVPDRTYLVGHSLGAAVVLSLAERFPSQYDGALALCGLLGGSPPEVRYMGDARVLFDHFFPGVLPYDTFPAEAVDFRPPSLSPPFPGSPAFLAVLSALQAGFFLPGQPTLQFASTARLAAASPSEIVLAGLNVIGFDLRFSGDILARTHGRLPYDNTTTVYSGSLDDAALNAGVTRVAASPDAVNYAEHYYTPSGQLEIPMLTLHTTRDPVVPAFHETLYAAAVAVAGDSQNLVQQLVDRFGHCAFTVPEVVAAFDALAAWVADPAMRPAGGAPAAP